MSNGRAWKLTVNEEELRALIAHNMSKHYEKMDVEYSARIHDLTKRLNKDTPEIEQEQQQTNAENQQTASNTAGGW